MTSEKLYLTGQVSARSADERRRAALVVADNAGDESDCRELLHMLGLTGHPDERAGPADETAPRDGVRRVRRRNGRHSTNLLAPP